MEALYIISGLLVLLISVVLIRTLAFRPKGFADAASDAVYVNTDKAVSDLSEMIKCATVSHADRSLDNEAEFLRFKNLLPTLFPNIFSSCEYLEPNDRAILIKIKGKTDGEPCVLMAHYDVVDVDEAKWQKPPFSGEVENGILWGRGSLDTKVTLNAAMQALEALLCDGFTPKCDVYLAFAGDEEINGVGAVSIVDYFEKNSITPSFVLDEGGAVVENVFPGVKAPCALIGVAEKGMLNIKLTCVSNGGHSSSPKPHTPVGILSRACARVENKPFRMYISAAAKGMFDKIARHSNFLYRMIFANLWLFAPLLDLIGKKTGGEMNALVRTTCAFTQMSGSVGMNVIPTEATMIANLRINPDQSVDSAINYIKSVINDDRVEVSKIYGIDPSRTSVTDGIGYTAIQDAINATWTGSIISPYLMLACSDSRHWGRISDRVYRFSAMALSKEERASIHANDERIPVDTVKRAVEFYTRLIKQI